MEDKNRGKSGIANGRLRRRGRREMYLRADRVSGGLDRHPTGLTAEFLLLVMFVIVEGGCCLREVVALERLLFEDNCCLREVEVGAAAKGKASGACKAEAMQRPNACKAETFKSWSYTGSWRFFKISDFCAQIAPNVRIDARIRPI